MLFSVCQVDVDVWHLAAYEVWWDDEGEADEEEKSDEEKEVGGEEGAPQVSVVVDMGCTQTQWCAESSCYCCKHNFIVNSILTLLCNSKCNDAVGNEKDGSRDGGEVLQEGGDQ